MRYVSHLWGVLASWNLAIDNVTGEQYWANITPPGQNGYTAAGNGQGTSGCAAHGPCGTASGVLNMRMIRRGSVRFWFTNSAFAAEPVKVFAAGSLTGAMNAVIKLYEEKNWPAGRRRSMGRPGLLRERIEKRRARRIFSRPPTWLIRRRWRTRACATQPVVMARNRLCAKALAGLWADDPECPAAIARSESGLGHVHPKGGSGWRLRVGVVCQSGESSSGRAGYPGAQGAAAGGR